MMDGRTSFKSSRMRATSAEGDFIAHSQADVIGAVKLEGVR